VDNWCLSVKQPWAWLLCKNLKDGENRTWPLPGHIHNRRVYIHASQSHSDMDTETYNWILERLAAPACYEFQRAHQHLVFGAIIGDLVFTTCMRDARSEWYTGEWFFRSQEGRLYDNPIPCRGELGFFKPKIEAKNALL
jgi:hypothetical protein